MDLKVFIVRKLLPLRGQVLKKYKDLVQPGKAIFLAFCGTVTGLDKKPEKKCNEFISTP